MSYRLCVLSRGPAQLRLGPFHGVTVCKKCVKLDLADIHAKYLELLPECAPPRASFEPTIEVSDNRPSRAEPIDLGSLQRSASLRRQNAGWVVSLLLITLALAFIAHWPIFDRSGLVQVEELLLIVYTSARIGMCMRAEQPRVVLLIAHLWVYTLFGLVQVVQLSKRDNPFHVYAPDSVMSVQLAIMLVGLLALDLSARCSRGITIAAVRVRTLSLRRVLTASWITLLATPLMIPRLGGVSALFSSRFDVTVAIGGYGGSLSGVSSAASTVAQFAEVAPFMCVFALLRLRQGRAFTFAARPDVTITFAGLLVAMALFDNPISQPRFWIATMAIAAVLSGRWLRRMSFQVVLVFGYILFSVVLFPFLDATRVTGEAAILYQQQTGGVTDSYLNKTDYGTMQDVAAAVTYVEHNGHTNGKQVVGAVFFFVPRALWEGKAQNTAVLLATDMGFVQNLNLDSPLWAEGYVDFGFVGVIVMLGVFGFFVGRADRSYLAGRTPMALSSILVPAFAGYSLIVLRGSLLQALARIFLIIIIGRLMSRRVRTDVASNRPASWLAHDARPLRSVFGDRWRRPWLAVSRRNIDSHVDADHDVEIPPPNITTDKLGSRQYVDHRTPSSSPVDLRKLAKTE